MTNETDVWDKMKPRFLSKLADWDDTNPPATTHGIERVREMVVHGVTLTDTLSFRPHVDRIVARTAQTSYALRLLRSHGLGAPQLFDVARATLVAQLTYASPA